MPPAELVAGSMNYLFVCAGWILAVIVLVVVILLALGFFKALARELTKD